MSKQKQSGHYCRICGRQRANEKFSGKGHRIHVCKDCQREQEEKKRLLKKARQRAAEVGLRPPKRIDYTRSQAASYLGITTAAFDYQCKKLGVEHTGMYEGRNGTGYLYDIETIIAIFEASCSDAQDSPKANDP
ncbi:MAG: hypothetical protein KJ064_06125 [Anaerolineae bacterium]|nr:hypothetical protein [Anaerolineae bacterium]